MTASIRPSTLADLELHVRHRTAMFRDMVMGDEAGLARMSERFRAWLRPRLLTGEVRGLVRDVYGVAVGSGLLWLREQMPVPLTELDLRGHVFNVYVEAAHRGQGHARALMVALEASAAEWGVEILELHASKDAEALYRGLGYEPTSEMRKVLKADLPVPHQWKDRR
ncbi:MAG TPA: GNAT family N-acetyltransferase [Holophagaceae bacterium]|nr:GNAT family N-acetyltransferase [Holophagaceae bacterium]